MNLSERLDAARRERTLGFAPELGDEAYVLRGRVEGQAYDGTALRTGEAMDAERWEQLQAERRGMELPRLYGQVFEEVQWTRPVSVFLDLTGDEPVVVPGAIEADALVETAD